MNCEQHNTSAMSDGDEYSLEAFRQKLDDLTESLENDINLENLLNEAKSLTPPKLFTPSQQRPQPDETSVTIGIENSPYVDEAIPPSIERYWTSGVGGSSSASTHVPSRTNRVPVASTPEPPTPVKTPSRNDYDRLSSSRRTVPDPYLEQRSRAARQPFHASPNIASPPIDHPSVLPNDWQRQLDQLCDTVQHQEERIRKLERKNDILRSIVMDQSPRHPRQSVPAAARHVSSSGPQRSSAAWQDRLSPGTRFVAELAQVIDLPEDQYEPLSRIMDRQLDRLGERHWEDESRR
jgi:hypothetical protein